MHDLAGLNLLAMDKLYHVSSIEPVILSMSYLEHNSHTRKSTLLAIETYPEALSIGHLESEQCQLALVVGQ